MSFKMSPETSPKINPEMNPKISPEMSPKISPKSMRVKSACESSLHASQVCMRVSLHASHVYTQPNKRNQLYAQFENELYNFKIIFGVDAGVISPNKALL